MNSHSIPQSADPNSGGEQYKIIAFDLPFVIFVKDNCTDRILEDWVAAVREGRTPPYSPYAPSANKTGAIAIGSASQVFLPSGDVAPPYAVKTSRFEATLRFIRRVNPNREMVIMGEVPGDRTGRASFSSVECFFYANALGDSNIALSDWASAAIEIVNHFIQHYRVIANRFYLYPVTQSIIQYFNIGTFTGGSDPTWQLYATGSGPVHMFGGAIPDDQDIRLRNAIANTAPPDVKLVLDQQVHSYLDLREWRLAIIETAVLFEAFLTYILGEYLKSHGRSVKEIHALLHRDDGRPHEVEHLAKAVVRRVTGFDFASTNEFQRWKEDVSRKRNQVVHGYRFDVSQAEAEQAFKANIDAANLLKRQLFGTS